MSACRTCGKQISWAAMPDGSLFPVDDDSARRPDGNLAVRRDGENLLVRILHKDEEPAAGEVRGIAHFASCPQAHQWRSRAAIP